jgi:3-hydroxyisobutyrate dehydrogenase-like beta-hydroxyacid dehydrogenase
MRVAVFGLGEAGGAIAGDLAGAGVEVRAYDPRDVATPAGVIRCVDPYAAVVGAEFVCALTAASDALNAIAQALDSIPKAAVYADFATSAAGLKQRLAAIAGEVDLKFADVALMAPVPGKGLRTPALVSGTGAERFAAAFGAVGMPVEHAGESAGIAATRKLLRSVVIKGFAALVIESMTAARAAGLADETWDNLVQQFMEADEAFLRRIVDGTYAHSLRRLHEMEATADMLRELTIDPLMTESTVESLRRINGGASPVVLPSP